MLEAEALVVRFDEAGIERARAFASDPSLSEERRRHYARVARIADRRERLLASVDTGTKYDIVNGWRCRRGQLIDG